MYYIRLFTSHCPYAAESQTVQEVGHSLKLIIFLIRSKIKAYSLLEELLGSIYMLSTLNTITHRGPDDKA